jgi:hypothetical protein
MPEIDLGFPRAFVEFPNPDDATEVFRCDLTWLTSNFMCIFGQGCAGIYETSPDAGCCTLGAHFADKADYKRVKKIVNELDPTQWENHDEGHQNGWTERDEDGDLKTRAFEGACIFHNSKDFIGGYGCALHGHALATGVKPHTLKPEVCWQLPIRREFTELPAGDGTTYTEVRIGEYTRRGWGPGGVDLDWYCSSNTQAHVGAQPVYLTNRDELEALMGEAGYAELVTHCEAFIAGGTPTPHPATVAARAGAEVREG